MRLRAYFISLLVLLTLTTVASAAPPGKNSCTAWSEDFNGTVVNPNIWVVANGQAPGYIAGVHRGYYVPANVSLGNGWLKLKLDQAKGPVDGNPNGVISSGALIYSVAKCGYGTYEWRMRMSSTASTPLDVYGNPTDGQPISGSVSAGFNYVNNSQTEIDFEFSALNSDRLWMVNWFNTRPRTAPTADEETATYLSSFNPWSAIHTYRFVWAPGSITYFVDGVQRGAPHTTNVPSTAAYIMINHWGTNSSGWGGPATKDTPRYFHIDRFSYTPPLP